jgi:hypothetical protein
MKSDKKPYKNEDNNFVRKILKKLNTKKLVRIVTKT